MPLQDLLERLRSLAPDDLQDLTDHVTSIRFRSAHAASQSDQESAVLSPQTPKSDDAAPDKHQPKQEAKRLSVETITKP